MVQSHSCVWLHACNGLNSGRSCSLNIELWHKLWTSNMKPCDPSRICRLPHCTCVDLSSFSMLPCT